ncbi:MAG: diguanylate cyclase [Dokdonella sp.]|uniref:diguanylate cyclase n=1 Tax=Dokdonella sp. TaxID=2291710 RepID=UPI0032643B56
MAAARLGLAVFLLFSLPAGAIPVRDVYPRAIAAASTLRASTELDAVLSEPATVAFMRALGGPQTGETLAWLAANAFSAAGANAVADKQWQRVAELARERGDDDRYGTALSRRADIALSNGNYAHGEEIAADLLALARRTGRSTYEAVAEENLGVIERRRGHLDTALTHQQRALELSRANNDPSSAALALANLATLYRDRGDFAQALDSALESVALRERSGDRLDVAYRNVALLYREIEDTATARTYFQRAIDIAARSGSPAAYAPVIGSYAGLLNDLGEFAAARRAAAEALAIDEALGDRPHQGLEHLELGRAMVGQREYQEAGDEFDAALTLGRELGQHEIVASALLLKADLALIRHDTLHARGLLDEATAGLESSQLRTQLAHAYASRDQLARAENNDADALRFAHKHAAVREELLGIRASRQLAALETRHARSEAEQRLALLGKDNELQAALLEKQGLQRNIDLGVLVTLGVLLGLVVWRFVGVSQLNRALAMRNAEIERHRATLGQANLRLERQAIDLYQVAITDSMTGVMNRGHLLQRLSDSIADSTRTQRNLAVLVIDFDHFKRINDLHGHAVGDTVLIEGVDAIRRCLRADDLMGRIGGEEFVAVIVDREADAVLPVAERIRLKVQERLVELAPGLRIDATVSIGVASLDQIDSPAKTEALLEAADRALYAAKSAGRNCVHRYVI